MKLRVASCDRVPALADISFASMRTPSCRLFPTAGFFYGSMFRRLRGVRAVGELPSAGLAGRFVFYQDSHKVYATVRPTSSALAFVCGCDLGSSMNAHLHVCGFPLFGVGHSFAS